MGSKKNKIVGEKVQLSTISSKSQNIRKPKKNQQTPNGVKSTSRKSRRRKNQLIRDVKCNEVSLDVAAPHLRNDPIKKNKKKDKKKVHQDANVVSPEPYETIPNGLSMIPFDPYSQAVYLGNINYERLLEKVPFFSGEILEYDQFMSQFQTIVLARNDIPSWMKYQLLCRRLHGTALEDLKSLQGDSALSSVLAFLKDCYCNKMDMYFNLLDKLQSLPSVPSDFVKMRISLLKIHNIISHMERIGPVAGSESLVSVIASKFPKAITKIASSNARNSGQQLSNKTCMFQENALIRELTKIISEKLAVKLDCSVRPA